MAKPLTMHGPPGPERGYHGCEPNYIPQEVKQGPWPKTGQKPQIPHIRRSAPRPGATWPHRQTGNIFFIEPAGIGMPCGGRIPLVQGCEDPLGPGPLGSGSTEKPPSWGKNLGEGVRLAGAPGGNGQRAKLVPRTLKGGGWGTWGRGGPGTGRL